jgi:flagellar hook protein FlgE
MLQAMFAGVSGLQVHQTRLNVVGNNIANVNTTGYKAGRVTFQDQLSQTLRYSSSPGSNLGGQNPMQVGLGVSLGAVDTLQTQGSLQSTGKATDMALQGNGFFLVSNGADVYYTRDGAFDLDSDGNLVNPANGLRLVGYSADSTGKIDTTKQLDQTSTLKIPVGTMTTVKATANATLEGNLNAVDAQGRWSVALKVYDSLGIPRSLTFDFTKATPGAGAPAGATGAWNWSVSENGTNVATSTAANALSFDANGKLLNTAPLALTLNSTQGASTLDFNVDVKGLTQFAGGSNVAATSQDGFPVGVLQSFTVAPDGVISGVFSNGQTRTLGQVASASFANASGLEKLGQNLFRSSSNSGLVQVGTPAANGRGNISTGYVEMSNVDLANEFTNMIITQRGFQANTRVITTVDDLLQEVISLKR